MISIESMIGLICGLGLGYSIQGYLDSKNHDELIVAILFASIILLNILNIFTR